MKKAVQNFIRSLGASSNYAGNTDHGNVKTLFITDPAKKYAEEFGKESIEAAVLNKFGFSLPFTLKTN